MRLDRILIDIFSWVKGVLWQQEQDEPQLHVYRSLTSVKGVRIKGALQLIRRETPRAIRTWRYLPHRDSSKKDILLCLDTLEKLTGERTEDGINVIRTERSYPRRNTHRITVLSVDHFLGPDGDFEGEEIFSSYYDFGDTHRWAIATTDSIAMASPFLWEQNGGAVRWKEEILGSKRSMMGH